MERATATVKAQGRRGWGRGWARVWAQVWALCGWLACAGVGGGALAGCGAGAVSRGEAQLDPSGKGHEIKGKASWYGDRFQGKKTASGEPFDMHALTAAHKTLPFGTLVEVVRPDNGQTVVVRINDRGPFTRGRVIDLSKAAAQRIDMVRAGVAPVQLKVLQWGQPKRRR